jgi:enamine deaminase RidA (YjgF/YER057c/UK114 family)
LVVRHHQHVKTRSNPATVHPPVGAYAHQVEIRDERLLIVSGQVGMTPDGFVPDQVTAQLEQALDNVRLNLEAAGMGMRDLVKLTIFLTEEVPGDERQRIMRAAVGEELPAATLVYVSQLAAPHLKAEVEALAAAP